MPQKRARVLAVERQSLITEALRTSRTLSTEDLSNELGVSLETIRRDFVVLERQGTLSRVHGGATIALGRDGSGTVAKTRIGRTAASMIRSGQTVIIDIGTTAVKVARAIPRDFSGTVATCSLLVAAELAEHPSVEVLVCGGKLRAGDLALSGATALDFFSRLHDPGESTPTPASPTSTSMK